MDYIENTTETLAFELTNEILAMELQTYHSTMPTFAVVLEFMFETGGVF